MNNNYRIIIILFLIPFFVRSQEYDAELVSQRTSIEVNSRSLTQDHYYELKVNNKQGEQHTDIYIPFSSIIKLSNLNALIKDSNGNVIKKLKKNDIKTRSNISDSSNYEDSYVKEFTLKHNSYPYTLVYTYTINQSEFFSIENWYPVIDSDVPTHEAVLEIKTPIDYPIKARTHLTEAVNINRTDRSIYYSWKTSYTNLIDTETKSSPLSQLVPSVHVNPILIDYEVKGDLSTWQSFGNWQYDLIKGLNQLPISEEIKIRDLIKNCKSKKEIVRTLYHYLQDETRYLNLTLETGGLKPYPASYVCDNKYGDCKALTIYLKSLLNYLNIKSYYTLVYAADKIKPISEDTPSQQFNHVILYIPLENEELWLDCTSKYAFNYLGTFTQNRKVLQVDLNKSRILNTPSLTKEQVLESRTFDINYNNNQTTINAYNSFRGKKYERLHSVNNYYDDNEKSNYISSNILPNYFKLKNFKLTNKHRDSLSMEVSYTANSNQLVKSLGEDLYVKNIPFSLPNFERTKDRKTDVKFDYPIHKLDSIQFTIPNSYKLNLLTDQYHIETKYGTYDLKIIKNKEKVILVKSILINAGIYPVSEYEDFYRFYKRVYSLDHKTYILLKLKS